VPEQPVNTAMAAPAGAMAMEPRFSAERRATRPVVVDLREVMFLDSSGVSVIAAAYRRAQPDSHRLVAIARSGSQVHGVLELTSLDRALGLDRALEIIDGPPLSPQPQRTRLPQTTPIAVAPRPRSRRLRQRGDHRDD
jgi:anti-anti-sigma factor